MNNLDLENKIYKLKNHYLVTASEFAYIAGSIIEGFGNVKSDIDLFIFYDDDEDAINKIIENEGEETAKYSIIKSENSIIYNFILDHQRYDCEIFKLKTLQNILNKIGVISYHADDFYEGVIPNSILDFMHRLKYAQVIAGEDKFSNICGGIEFDKLAYYEAMLETQRQTGMLEDLEGYLESKDYGSAFFTARIILDSSMSAFLSSIGETNPSKKWLFRKIKRYCDKIQNSAYLDRYLNLQSVKYEEGMIGFYSVVIEFCQELNMKTQEFIQNKQCE